jgi:hypothetical protein
VLSINLYSCDIPEPQEVYDTVKRKMWKNGRMEEGKNGIMEYWNDGRMEGWKDERLEDWRIGGDRKA